ncbi:Helix-turn-helix domain-containing protein [Hyphomicrobiales bacterium]|nr:Helix-turn-helix domain-containing protein [Hyphomicrobiales bacterium]CAH1692546.1 Helix-turn-helix domain-containing protein [Hyphomicrobiales bacterium]
MSGQSPSRWDGFIEFSPDQLSNAASNVPLSVDILSAGGSPSWIRQLQSPEGWALDTSYLNSHVRARGGFQRGCVVVLMATRPAQATICNVPLEPGVVLIIPDGHDIFASIKPGAAWTAAVLPTETWLDIEETATRVSVDSIRSAPKAVRLSRPGLQYVGNRLATLPSCLDEDDTQRAWRMPTAVSEYLGAIAEASLDRELADRQLDRSLTRRLAQAWKADDFIRAHLSDSLSVMRLCKELRVSRRQLEYAFRTTFDISPADYIQRTRLNESRRKLLSARKTGQSVTDVALETGITHLSRFAGYYQRLFGETPSDTARRR